MGRFVPIALVLLLVLVGCQQSSEPSAPPHGEQPAIAGSDPPATSTAKPAHGQRLVTATISDPKTFNPITAVDASSASATNELFDGLVRLNPVTMEEEPALAEGWERNDDGTVWTFHLRHGVRWHDHQPFTAADVVFTFNAIFDEHVPNSLKHVLMVDGQSIKVERVDDYTVRMQLPQPFAPLINSIGTPILPEHILGPSLRDGTFVQQWGIDTPPEKIVGTGPYRMTRYVPVQFIEYQRNPDYWMKDDAGRSLPYLESQTQLIVPNQDTMYLKFLSGQTDTHSPRPEEVADLRAKADQLQINMQEIGLDTGSMFIAFNRNPHHYVNDGKRDPRLTWFTDLHFLRAIAHAMDKQAMIINCLNGYGKPAVTDISPENKLFHDPNLKDYDYNLDTARQLLKEGGYVDRDSDGILEDSNGNPVELSLTTNAGNQIREKICSILKEDWGKLGIKVNYRPLDFQALVEKLYTTHDWDAVLIGFTGGIEPNNGANLLRSSGNLHFWNPDQPQPATPWEAEIDTLLDQGARELDTQKRRTYYWRIQEILHDQLPMIQTVRQLEFAAYKKLVGNYRPTVWGLYRPELIRIAE
jgi:peptide/nickel transport system substrate-binding protein